MFRMIVDLIKRNEYLTKNLKYAYNALDKNYNLEHVFDNILSSKFSFHCFSFDKKRSSPA